MRNLHTILFQAALAIILLSLLAACNVPQAGCVGVCLPTSAPAPTAASARTLDTTALDVHISRLMQDYDVPGVGLAVVQQGQIVYTKGYGVRDVTTGAPVTPNTQFGIGSVTKSFTALGVMLLVQEGKIRLDDRVTKYIPVFKLSDPSATAKVTVRHVLSHTTGMGRNDAATVDPTLTRADLLKLAATVPLHSQPGERYEYSNLNTTVAGVLIERISGQSWEDFTRARIFTPLGMTTATLDVDTMQGTPDFARPHTIDVLKGNQPTSFQPFRSEAPAGAINASAAEMARYVQFQVGDGRVNGQQLLSPDLLAEMHRPQIARPDPNDGLIAAAKAQGLPEPTSLITDTGYGFYWNTEDFQGHRLVWHNGVTAGFTALTMLIPETRGGVVILTNAMRASHFLNALRLHVAQLLLDITPQHDMDQIIQAQAKVLGQDNAIRQARLEAARSFKADPAQLESLSGEYQSLTGDKPSTVTVLDGRKLKANFSLQGTTLDTELIPYSAVGFLPNNDLLNGYTVIFKEVDSKTMLLLNGIPLAQK
jgi:CubicO group peptidase (beta-lactamase class C family)